MQKLVLVLLFASFATAFAQTPNTRALAQLRWYEINQVTVFNLPNTSVSGTGYAAAFDGSNIWVTGGDDEVWRIRPSDGAIIGRHVVQNHPVSLAWDGQNMWVLNAGTNSISKIRGSDGTNLGNIKVVAHPERVWFDGSNIYVVTYGLSSCLNVIQPSSGQVIQTLNAPCADWAVFDGRNTWLADRTGLVSVYDQTWHRLAALSLGSSANAWLFDGTYLWVGLNGTNLVKLQKSGSSINVVGNFPISADFLGFDGRAIWAGTQFKVTKLLRSDGTILSTLPFSGLSGNLAFDGADMWNTCWFSTSSVETLCKF